MATLALDKRAYLKGRERAIKWTKRRGTGGSERQRQQVMAHLLEKQRREQQLHEAGEGGVDGGGGKGLEAEAVDAKGGREKVWLVDRPSSGGASRAQQPLEYLCLLDIETTCDDHSR